MANAALNHIVITVTNLERSRKFYEDELGFELHVMPAEAPGQWANSFYFAAGGAHLFFVEHAQTAAGDRFDETRVGLDHLSFTAPDEAFLQEMTDKLRAAGVETNGVEVFTMTGNKYVAFRDPDNIQLEYWLPKEGE